MRYGKLINQSLRETRSLMMEISPPILYELGLVAALEWLTEQIAKEYAFGIGFQHKGDFENLPHDVSVLLFQAVRELLINAGKHSSAKKAAVAIHGRQNAIIIEVSDNGIGFDTSRLGKPTALGGFGLFSIKERLKSYNGKVTIRSAKGKGTKIQLKIPGLFKITRQRRTS